jgi:hypothetical protein
MQCSEQKWTNTLLTISSKNISSKYDFCCPRVGRACSTCGKLECRSQGNPKVSLEHKKGLNTQKLRVKSRNGSTNRCDVNIMLTERTWVCHWYLFLIFSTRNSQEYDSLQTVVRPSHTCVIKWEQTRHQTKYFPHRLIQNPAARTVHKLFIPRRLHWAEH